MNLKRISFFILLGVFIFMDLFAVPKTLLEVYISLFGDPLTFHPGPLYFRPSSGHFNLVNELGHILPPFFIMAFSMYMTFFLFKKLRRRDI